MAKKTTKDSTPNDHSDALGEITSIVCQLKHEAIDKEFKNIKNDAEKRHDEMKSIIVELQENIKKDIKVGNTNLKDKIVLTEKTIGEKIDKLSEFDDSLKGNGTPGIWESIRTLKRRVTIVISLLIAVIIISAGGSVKGLTKEKIKKIFGLSNTETKQVEPVEDSESSAMPKE